ncbi:hypothetical protein [Robertkochia flava]|uniref:hypothetical protein n=1 Tax=Robertkochia flava TaxID=3447986 RepID=UPI001CCEB86A|nr:hypothetical protein [Robertkochia marina]
MKFLYPFYLLLLFTGCSKSEGENLDGNSTRLPVVSAIAYTSDQNIPNSEKEVYHYTLSANGQAEVTEPLNTNFDIGADYLHLRRNDDKLTFFYRNSAFPDNYRFSEYFCDSGKVNWYDQICSSAPIASSDFYPLASLENTIHITHETIDGSYHFYLNIMRGDESCERIFMGQASGVVNDYHFQSIDEKFYFYYPDSDTSRRLTQIDLQNAAITNSIEIERPFRGIITKEMIHLYLDNGVHKTISTDAFTVSNAASYTSGAERVLAPGFTEVKLLTPDQALIKNSIPYPSPGALSDGPAILELSDLSLSRGENGFMYDLLRKAEEELMAGINFTSYTYDPLSQTVVVGYNQLNNEGYSGGVIYGDFEGNLKRIEPLPVSPKHLWIE